MQIQSKLIERKSSLIPITVEEELGHMEWKEVLEDLVGACAIMNNLK
jgi:hypothetical protein